MQSTTGTGTGAGAGLVNAQGTALAIRNSAYLTIDILWTAIMTTAFIRTPVK